MSKHSGGNANEDLLRDLRLAVWRHKEPEGEFMVLSQIRQTWTTPGSLTTVAGCTGCKPTTASARCASIP